MCRQLVVQDKEVVAATLGLDLAVVGGGRGAVACGGGLWRQSSQPRVVKERQRGGVGVRSCSMGEGPG